MMLVMKEVLSKHDPQPRFNGSIGLACEPSCGIIKSSSPYPVAGSSAVWATCEVKGDLAISKLEKKINQLGNQS